MIDHQSEGGGIATNIAISHIILGILEQTYIHINMNIKIVITFIGCGYNRYLWFSSYRLQYYF